MSVLDDAREVARDPAGAAPHLLRWALRALDRADRDPVDVDLVEALRVELKRQRAERRAGGCGVRD